MTRCIFSVGQMATTGFPRERAGLGTHLIDGRLKVTYVSPDGPAEAAGFKAGDEIVAVNGQAIRSEYYRADPRALGGRRARHRRSNSSAPTVAVKIRLADYY